MLLPPKDVVTREFRVALLLPGQRQIAVQRYGHGGQLPHIVVGQPTQLGQELSVEIYRRWFIWSVPIELLQGEDHLALAIVEVRSVSWAPHLVGLEAVTLADIGRDELTADERSVLEMITAGQTIGRSPFSKLGWVSDVQTWIQDNEKHEIIFTGDVCSYNPTSQFTLSRLARSGGPAYWLKATSSQQSSELAITQTLSQYCGRFLPRLVATRDDWNAWVTEEFGQPLRDCKNVGSYEKAVRCLAGVQLASIKHLDDLLRSGCCDQRITLLQSYLPKVECYLYESLVRGSSEDRDVLQGETLGRTIALVHEACANLQEIGLPVALIHNDLNAGNILIDSERAVLIDWAECCIGVPFVSFQHLRVQAREVGLSEDEISYLTAIYCESWSSHLTDEQITQALALIPPIAIASYLLGRDPLFVGTHRRRPVILKYVRTLANHLIRATRAHDFRKALLRGHSEQVICAV
jgi:hypothetical protein